MEFDKLAAAAVESFLQGDQQAAESRKPKRRRLRGVGAVALGAGLAVAARAAYSRVCEFDLEQLAGTVEEKLKR